MRFGYNDSIDPNTAKLGLLPDSGSDAIRLRLNWRSVEPQPGKFNWPGFDATYMQLLSIGIRPLWILLEAPCWAGDERIPCDPVYNSSGAPGPGHADDLGAFAAAVASRYPESLGIEIGNEQNDPTFWPNGQDPVAYTKLLAAASAAVDQVDPEMPIVAGGLVPLKPGEGRVSWRTYLGGMLDSGAADYVDAIAFHPYVRTKPDEDPGPVVGALVDQVRAFMAKRGAGEEPLWITEAGLTTVSRPPRTSRQQADGLVSILTQLQARGTPVTIIHRLVDEEHPDFPLEVGFGVIAVDQGTRKPAYCAIAAFRGVPCG